MRNYIDYGNYISDYIGKLIPQNEFEKYASRASGIVRNAIFNRDITYFEKEVINATCSVAELLYNQYLNKEKIRKIMDGTDKIITSEKVGDYSRNIGSISIDDLKKVSADDYIEMQIIQVLEDYLLSTGLLYCGGF